MPYPEESFIFNHFRIDNISVREAVSRIVNMIEKRERGYVVTPNASHFLYLRKDESFRESYRKAALVVPDGYSIVLASKILGGPIRQRCAGADIFDALCGVFTEGSYRIFILGGVNGSELRAREKLLQANIRLSVGTLSPSPGFEYNEAQKQKVIATVHQFSPDILFVFLGSPKSEKFISAHFSELNTVTALSLGAALDYFTGEKKRAPEWMRNAGLEWLFRFFMEPGRLWKRYLFGNAYFIFLTLRQFLHRHS